MADEQNLLVEKETALRDAAAAWAQNAGRELASVSIRHFCGGEGVLKRDKQELSNRAIRCRELCPDCASLPKKVADDALKAELEKFSGEFQFPALVVLVSGDAGYARALAGAREAGHEVIVVADGWRLSKKLRPHADGCFASTVADGRLAELTPLDADFETICSVCGAGPFTSVYQYEAHLDKNRHATALDKRRSG